MTALQIAGIVVVPLVVVVLLGIRIDREYQRGVIFRLGRFHAIRGPGFY